MGEHFLFDPCVESARTTQKEPGNGYTLDPVMGPVKKASLSFVSLHTTTLKKQENFFLIRKENRG